MLTDRADSLFREQADHPPSLGRSSPLQIFCSGSTWIFIAAKELIGESLCRLLQTRGDFIFEKNENNLNLCVVFSWGLRAEAWLLFASSLHFMFPGSDHA